MIDVGPAFASRSFSAEAVGPRLLRGDNVAQGRLRWDGARFWPSDLVAGYETHELREGDVVLAMDRPWIEAGLKQSVVRASDLPALLVQRVARLRARPGVDQGFLRWLIAELRFTGYIRSVSTGSTVPHISQTQIADYPVPRLPDLGEQRAIAGVLGALDDKIESNRRLAKLLESETQLLFKQLFDLQPSDGGLPLDEVVDLNPRRTIAKGSSAPYVPMAFLPTASALVDRWETRVVGSGQRFVNGDVLMARITPCLENGKGAFVDFLPDGQSGWGSTEYIVLRSRRPLPEPWAYCLTREPVFVDYATRHMSGTSGRQRCSADALRQFRVGEFTDSDAKDFGEIADPAFKRMSAARNENRSLAELRDALLPELLSGRLRVPVAEEIVESAT